MAKSMRAKKVKRLRAIRREIVEKEDFYQKKDDAKNAAIEAALAAPKLAVRSAPSNSESPLMDATVSSVATSANDMDLDMGEGGQSTSLKPVGVIGKKSKRKFKMGKKNRRGKGILRGKKNL